MKVSACCSDGVVVIHRAWLALATTHVWGPQTSVQKQEEVMKGWGLLVLFYSWHAGNHTVPRARLPPTWFQKASSTPGDVATLGAKGNVLVQQLGGGEAALQQGWCGAPATALLLQGCNSQGLPKTSRPKPFPLEVDLNQRFAESNPFSHRFSHLLFSSVQIQ